MDIIKPSQLKYESVKYHGVCPRCGCEFTAYVGIAIGLNGFRKYRNIDNLDHFSISNDETYFHCDCPECGMHHVKLERCE